jgi:hypothetical protein
MRVVEAGFASENGHVVALQLIMNYLDLFLFHLGDSGQESLCAWTMAGYQRSKLPIKQGSARFQENGFSKRLAGNGSCVDTDTSDEATAFDQSGALPEFGSLHSRPLPGRAAPDAK